MSRPVRALIDLSAVERNARLAAELAAPARVVAVIKADAYGHGAIEVARALVGIADAFGVASVEEAVALRDAGVTERILLLAGLFAPQELEPATGHRLDTVVHSAAQLDLVCSLPPSSPPLRVWLKMDSGMHRLGFAPAAFADAYETLRAASGVGEIVLMTHLGRADEIGSDATRRQLERFARCSRDLDAPHSLANSAALLAWPATRGDWVRPGIMLYGLSPLDRSISETERLRPAMRFESEIVAVRELAAGEPIGYGGDSVCARRTRLGVVAVGYGDGYPRHAPDGTPLLVDDRRAPLLGRVSMDLLTVDLTDLGDVRPGAPVELWGQGLSANEVAASCGTIAYELVTRVAARVPRRYRRSRSCGQS